VLEGSVRRSEQTVRVAAQLINAVTSGSDRDAKVHPFMR